jgi:hypothetical protein
MDPVRNPFAPGAGSPPPELAGRDHVLEMVQIAIDRAAIGRPSKNHVLIGLRGVGKTVLLDQIRKDAEVDRHYTLWIEAPEHRSLPAVLAPELRTALLKLSRIDAAAVAATRALRALSGFVRTLKVKYADIELSLDADPEPGLADNGNLEQDLTALLEVAGEAARTAGKTLVVLIDELQYVRTDELGSLISALHRCSQRAIPVILVAAGLPQLRGEMGRAKTYSERLFEFHEIGPLTTEESEDAIAKPLHDEEVEIDADALQDIVNDTQGYPYFLQEWGKHAWDVADASPITAADVAMARITAVSALDASFFGVRFDRLTPSEQQYLRAMAELGPGPHRSGDIAAILGKDVQQLGPVRSKLITKGMIWSPAHGDTAFTVPMFDEFLKRVMPNGPVGT